MKAKAIMIGLVCFLVGLFLGAAGQNLMANDVIKDQHGASYITAKDDGSVVYQWDFLIKKVTIYDAKNERCRVVKLK